MTDETRDPNAWIPTGSDANRIRLDTPGATLSGTCVALPRQVTVICGFGPDALAVTLLDGEVACACPIDNPAPRVEN